jgi:hypothetical protein
LLELAADEKQTHEKLKAKRQQLFERFSKNPRDIHLAVEIKLLDDQLAELTRQLDRKTASRRVEQP